MGASCTGCANGSVKRCKQGMDIEVIPQDIVDFSPTSKPNLPHLKFDAMLSNIKVVNAPKSTLSLKFYIQDIVEVLLPRKTRSPDSNELKWKSKEKFVILLNDLDIRKKFLNIQATDDKGKIVSTLKMNLYKIAIGPYHHDFRLVTFNKIQSRIQFDFKISQYIETSVECQETEISLNKKYPGQSFHLTIRILKEEKEAPFESTPSYSVTLPVDSSQEERSFPNPIDQCPSPLKARGRANAKTLKSSSKVNWSSSHNNQMPNFTIFLKAHQLKKSLLHLVIWKGDKLDKSQKQGNFEMLCDAFVPISKLFDEIPSEPTDSSKEIRKELRSFELKGEKLWNNGETYGEFSMKLKTQNSKFINQMSACGRTEDGIISMVPYVHNYGIKKQNGVENFSSIDQSMNKIEEKNMQINQNNHLSYLQTRKLKEEMVSEFQKILYKFQESMDKSFALPSNDEQRRKNIEEQKYLLDMIGKMIPYLDQDQSISDISWKTILCISKRGEFSLSNIGFSKEEQEQMNTKMTTLHKKKLKIGIEYQETLYKLFLQSLRLGYIEGRDNPRNVIEMMKAFCYFRIPIFRDILLNLVVRKEDQSVEWKIQNTEKDLQNIPETQNALVFQLDWENYFYRPLLAFEPKSQALNKQLEENLQGNQWLSQMRSRSSTFHYFLYFLIKRLSELGKKIKFIKWQYFPGYNKLVRSFLSEMKRLKLTLYPKSLIQTSVNLLANQKLINILILLVFEKTHSLDSNQVMKSLELVSRYLAALTKQKKLLPPTFNYLYFFKALKIICEGDFSVAVVKCLVIIYNNYQSFNIEFRKNISLYLLGKVFFKLFLHWSNSVRNTFFHILILKIDRATDVFNSESRQEFGNRHQIMNEISTRYSKVMQCIQRAAEKRKQELRKETFKALDKDLYKVMKKKLKKKKGEEGKVERQPSITSSSNGKKKISPNKNKTAVKETPPSRTGKYSTQELSAMNNLSRSYSVTFSSDLLSQLQLARNDLKKQPGQKRKKQKDEEEAARTKSGAYNLDSDSQSENWKDTNKTKNPPARKRRLSVYGADDFQLKQFIEKQEIQYIEIAKKEFDRLDKEVREYYRENEELPECDLEVQIPIDEKEIKPDNVNMESWESSFD